MKLANLFQMLEVFLLYFLLLYPLPLLPLLLILHNHPYTPTANSFVYPSDPTPSLLPACVSASRGSGVTGIIIYDGFGISLSTTGTLRLSIIYLDCRFIW
jgi:hypothetical protein